MLNGNGTAYADGTRLKPRFLTWFFGNGVDRPQWVPPPPASAPPGASAPRSRRWPMYKQWLIGLSGYDLKVPLHLRPQVLAPRPVC